MHTVDNFSVVTLQMAENHLPPVLVVQGRPLLLLGLVLVTGVRFFSAQLSGILSPKKTAVSYLCCFVREATSSLSNSSSPATFVLSGAVARTGGSASSCATSSSAACTLMESSSLLDLRLGSFSSSEDLSEEGETEGRLRRSWPAPGGLRLEEIASIFSVGRRAHTSVRSCVIVPMFVLSCLRVDSILGSRPGGSVFWSGGPAEEGTTSTPSLAIMRYWINSFLRCSVRI